MQGKHAFAQECFYLQDIFSYLNQRVTFSHDCEHKHMLENGVPPVKFGVMYGL